MKKKPTEQSASDELSAEYDLSKLKGRVRGKFAGQMANGYTVTIHHTDGTKTVKSFGPTQNPIVLDPDIKEYFPDSKAVNQALRALVRIADKRIKKTF
ncbi:MAG: hypothetical protein EYC68_12220 [Chloroflexota bacterium]|nr:MAG: hypothetical protein EYC68_12220 [Chloroflexota bacterium]